MEAEAPPDRSFIEEKRRPQCASGMTPARWRFNFRLINPAKSCREAREDPENWICHLINPAATVMDAVRPRTAPEVGHFTKLVAASNREFGEMFILSAAF